MYLTSLVVLVLAVVVLLMREKLSKWNKKLPAILMIFLSSLACGSYFSNSAINYWDSFHYYVGAKYFPELGYYKLYECVTIADSQEPAWSWRVSNRTVTNLKDNSYINADIYLKNPENCTSQFSQERWAEFKNDVKFFRDHLGEKLWEMVVGDRGFNATPVWTSYAHMIFNQVPLTQNSIAILSRVDHILLVSVLMIVIWQFGALAGGAVAILTLTMPFLTPGWVLGGMFRLDWVFLVVLSILAIKKESYLTAGLLLTMAIGLRLYPVIMLFGLVAYWMSHYKDKNPLPDIKNFALGVLIGVVFVFNLIVSQFNLDSISESYKNLTKLQGTTLTNKVGVNTILGYSEPNRLEKTFEKRKYDAYAEWRKGVRKNQEQWRPLFLLICGIVLFMIIKGCQRLDIVSCYVSSLLLMVLIDPFNYYYVIFPLVLIAIKDRLISLSLVLFTGILALIYFMFNPVVIGSVVHEDVKFLLASYQFSLSTMIILATILIMNRKKSPSSREVADHG